MAVWSINIARVKLLKYGERLGEHMWKILLTIFSTFIEAIIYY